MKIARINLRASTDDQDLQRREQIITDARAAAHYVGKALGARTIRPELLHTIDDPQVDEIVRAEQIDLYQPIAFGRA